MNYIDIFLEAMSAEKGRSQKTLIAYSSDLKAAQNEIGDLLNATNEDIQNYCKEHNNMPFFMCSAKDNVNLEEAFNKVVDMALEYNKKDDENFVPEVKNLKLTQEPKKKKKCCK